MRARANIEGGIQGGFVDKAGRHWGRRHWARRHWARRGRAPCWRGLREGGLWPLSGVLSGGGLSRNPRQIGL